jgi:hypothetical protein
LLCGEVRNKRIVATRSDFFKTLIRCFVLDWSGVTFDGKPIPAGTITFLPYGAGKPGRTAGFCEIKGGKYATQTGRSPGSGPHRVLISGCDGVPYKSQMGEIVEDHPMGKQLFPTHLVELDVPEKNDTVFDFAVPGKPQP